MEKLRQIKPGDITRRQFLKAAGSGALAVSLATALDAKPAFAQSTPILTPNKDGDVILPVFKERFDDLEAGKYGDIIPYRYNVYTLLNEPGQPRFIADSNATYVYEGSTPPVYEIDFPASQEIQIPQLGILYSKDKSLVGQKGLGVLAEPIPDDSANIPLKDFTKGRFVSTIKRNGEYYIVSSLIEKLSSPASDQVKLALIGFGIARLKALPPEIDSFLHSQFVGQPSPGKFQLTERGGAVKDMQIFNRGNTEVKRGDQVKITDIFFAQYQSQRTKAVLFEQFAIGGMRLQKKVGDQWIDEINLAIDDHWLIIDGKSKNQYGQDIGHMISHTNKDFEGWVDFPKYSGNGFITAIKPADIIPTPTPTPRVVYQSQVITREVQVPVTITQKIPVTVTERIIQEVPVERTFPLARELMIGGMFAGALAVSKYLLDAATRRGQKRTKRRDHGNT